MTPNHQPRQKGFRAARVAMSLAPVFWGVTLLGVAVWLLKGQEPGAALPCLIFSAGYFWFAWSLFIVPIWNKGSGSVARNDFPVLELRGRSEPVEPGRDPRTLRQAPRMRARPRSSRNAA
jgi:hypothetical protein